ncbi:DUF4149 domain-containing protein [Methylophaga sp. OBS1]|uniref:DUF4149 domain-containing protein n=1 Tax=Methylophaga sp. OBS1 TaxID=2991933 RepID=UPI00225B1386|nr:DUF4149 domain-containing protein [Methylophaga sp. OBS1]MCX4192909.1 DUF4149 domain-containing protein [Methylophaga sp. OBS1]
MFSGYSGERLLLTLWVGSLWAIGYLAVPMAFANLEVHIAGNYAGKLFYAVNIIGVVSATILLISRLFIFGVRAFPRYWRSWLILLMLLVSLAFAGFIQPEMQALKQLGLEQGSNIERFNDLHKLSENLYLLLSLFGLMLVLTSDKRAEAANEA